MTHASMLISTLQQLGASMTSRSPSCSCDSVSRRHDEGAARVLRGTQVGSATPAGMGVAATAAARECGQLSGGSSPVEEVVVHGVGRGRLDLGGSRWTTSPTRVVTARLAASRARGPYGPGRR